MKVSGWLRKNDSILSLFFIVTGLIILSGTPQLRYDSALGPRFASVLIVLLGIVLAVKSLRTESGGGRLSPWLNTAELTFMSGTLITVLLVETAGFYLMLFIMMLLMSLYLYKPLTIRKCIIAVVYSTSVTTVLFMVFRQSMRLFTPRGVLF